MKRLFRLPTDLLLILLLMLSGCGKPNDTVKDQNSNTGIYSLSDGRYILSDGSLVTAPYILISDGKFSIIKDVGVSYQPSGDVLLNGNELVLRGIFANEEYCYTFTLTADDTIRFELDRSTVLQSIPDFEWKDGLIFTPANKSTMNESQTALSERFAAYYGLDASNGLDIIVWQMAENSYSFGLLEHSEEQREWLSEELMHLKGVNADQMKTILSSYDVSEDDIYIIPWQNPISSYIAELWIAFDSENIEAKTEKYEEYVENIRDMLLG